jgi:hypothetical protein
VLCSCVITVALEELVSWIAKCREVLEATGQISLETTDKPVEPEASSKAPSKATVKRANSKKN